MTDWKKWRDEAIADGWEHRPLFLGQTEDESVVLELANFQIVLNIAKNEILGWGPDYLLIEVPEVYDFNEIYDSIYICHFCHKSVATIQRIGKSLRACPPCYQEYFKTRDVWDN